MTLGIKLLMASNFICNEIQKINISFYVHSKIEFTIRRNRLNWVLAPNG